MFRSHLHWHLHNGLTYRIERGINEHGITRQEKHDLPNVPFRGPYESYLVMSSS